MEQEEKELQINKLESEKRCLVADLTSPNSPVGDWKQIKQLETSAYTDEEMKEYRAKRQAIRERINVINNELDKLK